MVKQLLNRERVCKKNKKIEFKSTFYYLIKNVNTIFFKIK